MLKKIIFSLCVLPTFAFAQNPVAYFDNGLSPIYNMDEVKDKITTKILFKAPGENVCVLVQSKPKSYLINPAASPNDPRRSHRSELRTSLTLNCIGSSISILVPHNPKSIDKTISLMKKTLRWLGISDIKKGGNALVFVAATPSSSSVS